jgi:hypothetical protein
VGISSTPNGEERDWQVRTRLTVRQKVFILLMLVEHELTDDVLRLCELEIPRLLQVIDGCLQGFQAGARPERESAGLS